MVGAIIVGIVGILCVVMGYLLWKKEKISLLHSYHYEYVSDEDKSAFCALTGGGILAIGTGLLITAVIFGIAQSLWSFLAMGMGFVVGIALLVCADRRYNTRKTR